MRQFPQTRLRRLRYNPLIRDMVQETELSVKDFIYPLFVCQVRKLKNQLVQCPMFIKCL